jgi:hypothetical protein
LSISPFTNATALGAVAAYRSRADNSQEKARELGAQASDETFQEAASADSLVAAEKALDSSTVKTDPEQELNDYMNMSTAEKQQWSWMNSRGISKEAFEAMSPEDKQKMLDKMREELKPKTSSVEVDRSQNPPIDVYV